MAFTMSTMQPSPAKSSFSSDDHSLPLLEVGRAVMVASAAVGALGITGAGWDWLQQGTPFSLQAALTFVAFTVLVLVCRHHLDRHLIGAVTAYTHATAIVVVLLALLKGEGVGAPGLPALYALALYQGLHARTAATVSYAALSVTGVASLTLQGIQERDVAVEFNYLMHAAIVQVVALLLLCGMGAYTAHRLNRASSAIRMLRTLFAQTSEYMGLLDPKTGEFKLANPALKSLGAGSLQLARQARQARQAQQAGQARKAAEVQPPDANAAPIIIDMTVTRPSKRGPLRVLEASLETVQTGEGEQLALLARDVTEQRRQFSEYLAVMGDETVCLCVVRDGVVTQASRGFEQLLGLAPSSAVGRRIDDLLGRTSAPLYTAPNPPPAFATGGLRISLPSPGGRPRDVQVQVRPVDHEEGPGIPLTGGEIWQFRDISLEVARERELERARADAERASEAKSRFLALMSHEIRTPLNGISGLLNLALDSRHDPQNVQQWLVMMQDSARTLSDIVDDVLDMSKIEAGRFELQPTHVDLRSVFDRVHDIYRPLAEARGLRLEVSVDPGLPATVRADGLRLRQVLANYVSNALKYTMQGQVTCNALAEPDGWMRVEVTDTGIGLSQEQQSRLFRPFEQARASWVESRSTGAAAVAPAMTQDIQGTGLGLSICAELADLMGGSVGVSSTPGVGSTFWLRVPLEAVSSNDAQDAPAADPGDSTPQQHAAPTPPVRLDGQRLLVVDDNRINRVVAEKLLVRAGAQVSTATDGASALALFSQAAERGEPYTTVLMDLQMPGMSGVEAAQSIRRHPAGAQVRIIATTAAVMREDVRQALASGMDDFAPKPLDWTDLALRIHRLHSMNPGKPEDPN